MRIGNRDARFLFACKDLAANVQTIMKQRATQAVLAATPPLANVL
jgi:hypothetical protein